jgi:hypothetical protein
VNSVVDEQTITKLHKNAEIELKHIQLELQNGRTQHLRHFVDQYYCYRNGLVKRSGRADWERVVGLGIVSTAARRVLHDRELVVKEHAVPLLVITRLLKERASNGGLSEIASVLHRYTVFGTITKEEDRALRSAKLTSSMPYGFDIPGHQYFDNVLARYSHVGIALEPSESPL